jgi:hypothetical protein
LFPTPEFRRGSILGHDDWIAWSIRASDDSIAEREIARPTVSFEPPTENGTISAICLDGYVCARTAELVSTSARDKQWTSNSPNSSGG